MLQGFSGGASLRELLRALGASRRQAGELRGFLRGLDAAGVLVREAGRYRLTGPRPGEAPHPSSRDSARRKPRALRPKAGEILGVVASRRQRLEVRVYPDRAGERLAAARGFEEGDVVRVEPPRGRHAARLRGPIGRAGDPEVDFEAICSAFDLPERFPEACLAQVDALPPGLPWAERRRRVDLRSLPLVTIDPESARDHDDAVFVQQEGRGWRLFVAIADVASRVPEGSPVDREARRRGNSVYFPDRAIGMLPPRLTADLCSLRPEVDRAAWVVELSVSDAGSVLRRSLYPAMIRSHARLNYRQAADAMAGHRPAGDRSVQAGLLDLAALAGALHGARLARGALELDLGEARVLLGADGRPRDVLRTERTPAHRAVEEAMLVANEVVAGLMQAAGRPTLLRVHEGPDPGDLAELATLLRAAGVHRGVLKRQELPRVLLRLAGHPAEGPLQARIVRALKQARYAPQPIGHFALGSEAYLHFTSPIRRYADLVVHRGLHRLLRGERPPRRNLEHLAQHLSERERHTASAERRMHDLKVAALLADRVGKTFRGQVTAIFSAGMAVRLEEPFVEGVVPVWRLASPLRMDERQQTLQTAGRVLHLGDTVRVRLVEVDRSRARLTLALAQSPRLSSSAARRSQAR